jgi:hypothetical protein
MRKKLVCSWNFEFSSESPKFFFFTLSNDTFLDISTRWKFGIFRSKMIYLFGKKQIHVSFHFLYILGRELCFTVFKNAKVKKYLEISSQTGRLCLSHGTPPEGKTLYSMLHINRWYRNLIEDKNLKAITPRSFRPSWGWAKLPQYN